MAFSLAACSGKSSAGQRQAGGSAGQGASSADGTGTGGEAAGLDYFMSLEGDLPSRRLTQSCAEHETDASVPVFDLGDSLEASMQRFQAFIGCDGDERLEVWRVLHPNDDSAGGFYTAADGVTYSVCGTTS
ncbi:MAG TPA: hypothetical protein VLJ38_06435, partial [Polyangiaceae bacterium]|nr:hypothetical protein [Polyangiaceae bacterium]